LALVGLGFVGEVLLAGVVGGAGAGAPLELLAWADATLFI
jgi:hypothetical protein